MRSVSSAVLIAVWSMSAPQASGQVQDMFLYRTDVTCGNSERILSFNHCLVKAGE